MSNKTKRLIIIISLLFVIILVAFAFYMIDSKYKQELAMLQVNCQNQINSLQNELNEKKVQVWVPINDIQAGQVISPDMLERITIFSDSDSFVFLDADALLSKNVEAVDSLRKYLEGERTQEYEEEYEESYDVYEEEYSGEDAEESYEDAEESYEDTEGIDEIEEVTEDETVSFKARDSVVVMSSVDNLDVPVESTVTSDEDEYTYEDYEDYDEVIESVSSTVDELTGIVAVTDLPAGQPIYKTAVQIMDCTDLREKFINFVKLNTNLTEGSTVDIRIKFPNGEDYVILSKEVLRDLNLAGAEFYLWVNEESILRLSAATVDAAINGGEIYVTRYVKPSIQDPLVYTYQPPEDVLRLIQWDPNVILEAENTYSATRRNEFEARLQAFLTETSGENSDISTTVTN